MTYPKSIATQEVTKLALMYRGWDKMDGSILIVVAVCISLI